jgi:uncharacterized protein (DUF2147 family)
MLAGVTIATAQSDPAGTWRVEDNAATIRIVDCGGAYWGVVAWEKQPGVDRHNPDASLRSRPTLGIPVLLDMRADGHARWSGRIYNAENGQTYDSHIALKSSDTLRVEGCVLGFMCGGETWRRVEAAPAVAQSHPAPSHATTGAGRPKPSIAEEPASRICSSVGRR